MKRCRSYLCLSLGLHILAFALAGWHAVRNPAHPFTSAETTQSGGLLTVSFSVPAAEAPALPHPTDNASTLAELSPSVGIPAPLPLHPPSSMPALPRPAPPAWTPPPRANTPSPALPSAPGESGSASAANALTGKPEAVFTPKPPYPPAARRRGVQGVVVLKVGVASDGRVVDVRVERSSGNTLLDESARSTILQRWRFRSRPDAVSPDWSLVRVRFDLQEA